MDILKKPNENSMYSTSSKKTSFVRYGCVRNSLWCVLGSVFLFIFDESYYVSGKYITAAIGIEKKLLPNK